MNRTEIINSLIKKNNYSSYLEIGVQTGLNFNAINALIKIGVDPDPTSKANVHLTSDEFFEKFDSNFDIVFIDGLHHSDQVYKDILNALKILRPNGIIVCHDMIPFDEQSQVVPRIVKRWTGDCWKAFVRLRVEREDLEMSVVDTDCGIGLIKVGKQTIYPHLIDTYSEFESKKREALNIIQISDFIMKYL